MTLTPDPHVPVRFTADAADAASVPARPGATYVASLCLIDLSNEKSCLKASTPKWPQQRLFSTFLSCIRLCGLSLEKHDARRKLPLAELQEFDSIWYEFCILTER